MSFAGKLARGLLQGASGYFGEVAEQQEYDRRAQILAQRDEALELLRQSGRAAELESLQGGRAVPDVPARKPGTIRADGQAFWDGRAWVPLTAATRPQQERLERHGR